MRSKAHRIAPAALLGLIVAAPIRGALGGEPKSPRILVVSAEEAEPHKQVAAGFRESLQKALPAAQIAVQKTASKHEGVDLVFSVGAEATGACLVLSGTPRVVAALIVDE